MKKHHHDCLIVMVENAALMEKSVMKHSTQIALPNPNMATILIQLK